MRVRSFSAGFAACYAITGLLGGLAMKAAIPALNGLGVAYIAATYPVAIGCTAFKLPCSNVPSPKTARWLFTLQNAQPEPMPGSDSDTGHILAGSGRDQS